MQLVNDLRTLKALEKAGFITLHPHTGKTVTNLVGGKVKAWYIDDYDRPYFTYKGVNYNCKYVSGSFYPYVFYA